MKGGGGDGGSGPADGVVGSEGHGGCQLVIGGLLDIVAGGGDWCGVGEWWW